MEQDSTALAQERTDLARIRTRLANKRTFLAWYRTVLAVMGFGFLLEKMHIFLSAIPGVHHNMKSLEATGRFLFLFAPALLVYAGWQYWRYERKLGYTVKGSQFVPEIIVIILIVSMQIFVSFS